jgi:hypothetical protein
MKKKNSEVRIQKSECGAEAGLCFILNSEFSILNSSAWILNSSRGSFHGC